jgi:hypothetical protein
MIKHRLPFLLQCLVLLIPVNIYVIGDWMATGVRWALFRYQQGPLGSSVISIGNDFQHLLSGTLQGRSAVILLLWIIAALLLILCLILNLATLQKQTALSFKIAALLILLSGLLFAVSDIVQYGITFHSSSGFCIPIGIPLILVIGAWSYRNARDSEKYPELDKEMRFCEKIQLPYITIPEINRTLVINELSLLIFISLLMKILVFGVSFFSPREIFHADITLYYNYVLSSSQGFIPYIDYGIEYPQFFFIPVLIALIPTILIQGLPAFSVSFMVLMYIFDVATLIGIYFIAIRLFGQKRAFLSGLLYATAFSVVFFVPLTYDIFPTFLLVASLLLFLYQHETAAFVSATAGALAKWFPAVCYPFFVFYTLKNKKDLQSLTRGIVLSVVLIAFTIVPLLYLKPDMFLETYTIHLNRYPDGHSFIYYLYAICSSFFHIQPVSGTSFILLVIGECALIAWYYRVLDKKQVTLCAVLFLSIFFFILVNPAGSPYFLIWITPFLALFFVNSWKEILLFYLVQIITYVEDPILIGIIWSPGTRYSVFENSLPSFAFLYYTTKYLILGTVFVYFIWRCKCEYTMKSEEITRDSPVR